MLQVRRQPGWTRVRTISVVGAAVSLDARLTALQTTSVGAVLGGQAVSVTKVSLCERIKSLSELSTSCII